MTPILAVVIAGLDIGVILFSLILAYAVKFKVGWAMWHILAIPFGKIYEFAQIEPYIRVAPILVTVWITALVSCRAYERPTGLMPLVNWFVIILKAASFASGAIMAMTFFYRLYPESRYVMMYLWIFGGFGIWMVRVWAYRVELALIKKGVGVDRVVVIGTGRLAQDITERLLRYPSLRQRYVGTIADEMPSDIHYRLRDQLRILGPMGAIDDIIKDHKINRIYTDKSSPELVNRCIQENVILCQLSDVSVYYHGQFELTDLDGIPFTQFSPTFSYRHWWMKRMVDILLGVGLLVVLSPLMLMVAMVIRLVSPTGPVLYRQVRVGRHGKAFPMIKFRTMIPDAETGVGPVMVSEKSENRYIRFGRLFRQWSIDELPQLINIVKGDMSFVGPRPERPYFVEKFSKEWEYYGLRHQVPGGLTGWAQVNGRAFLTNRPDQKALYDLYYIHNWSLLLDIKILIATIGVVLRKEEAY